MPYADVYNPAVAASGERGWLARWRGVNDRKLARTNEGGGYLGEVVYHPMSHPHFKDAGLGQELTIDQIAQRTMHDLAVRIYEAKVAGQAAEEARLREELARVSAIFRGFATEAEKRAAAEEAAEFDPIGLKGAAGAARMVSGATSLTALAGLGLLAFLAFPRK